MFFADIRFCTELDAAPILEVDKTSPYPWPERIIVRDLRNGAELAYLGAFSAGEEERLLGYAVLGHESGSGLLMNVVVLPEYRRLGLGMQLVVAAAECASALACPSLLLRVRPSNFAALELYRSLGFVCGKKHARYYNNGEFAQQMSLKLPLLLK
ncbi:MAG: GNAT family N-acetyltransferase [Synergistaceae bacterium]|nr:GNAT family N-acetyltransferase [Synergistaceae bacterium]